MNYGGLNHEAPSFDRSIQQPQSGAVPHNGIMAPIAQPVQLDQSGQPAIVNVQYPKFLGTNPQDSMPSLPPIASPKFSVQQPQIQIQQPQPPMPQAQHVLAGGNADTTQAGQIHPSFAYETSVNAVNAANAASQHNSTGFVSHNENFVQKQPIIEDAESLKRGKMYKKKSRKLEKALVSEISKGVELYNESTKGIQTLQRISIENQRLLALLENYQSDLPSLAAPAPLYTLSKQQEEIYENIMSGLIQN